MPHKERMYGQSSSSFRQERGAGEYRRTGAARSGLLAPLLVACGLVVSLAGCNEPPPTWPELWDRVEPVARPSPIRGIYVNAFAAGSPTRLAELLDLATRSSLNTFVIDVKEGGEVSYLSAVPLVDEIGAARTHIGDLSSLLGTLRDRGIYPIARIVVFRDPLLARARPTWSIQTSDGEIWHDPDSGHPWVDPFNPEVWAYNIDLAREALAAGFAEIQWDYVRFPDVASSVRATMSFPDQAGRTPPDAIHDFLARSRRELAGFGAPITADVFARVITETDDSGIGQDWDRLVQVTDVLLPMVYPSLYHPGNFGLPDPGAEPYLTVHTAVSRAVARLRRSGGAIAQIRPWLQAFSLEGTAYGPQQMRDQIRAVEHAGVQEWLFWNPGSFYPPEAF